VGWLWFLITLAPVIGLIQFGAQAYADRYTYIPLIGVFIVAAWRLAAYAPRSRLCRVALTAAAGASVLVLAVLCWQQTRHWRDSETLWRRAVTVTTDNHTAHLKLGNALVEQRRYDEAEAEYREALRIWPDGPRALNNLSRLRLAQDRPEEAAAFARQALARSPGSVYARVNLGIALATLGRADEALEHLEKAVELDPRSVAAHFNLAAVLSRQGRWQEAAECLRAVLAEEPGHEEAREYLQQIESAGAPAAP